MEPLKVSKEFCDDINEYLGSNPSVRDKYDLLKNHELRINGEGWKGYNSFNNITYDQMYHALKYGFEVDDIPNYEEIKKSIEKLCNVGWDMESLLKFRLGGNFGFTGTGKPIEDLSYEQLEYVLNSMKREYEDNKKQLLDTFEKIGKEEVSKQGFRKGSRKIVEIDNGYAVDTEKICSEARSVPLIYAEIDVAIDTNDEDWFMELTNELKYIEGADKV